MSLQVSAGTVLNIFLHTFYFLILTVLLINHSDSGAYGSRLTGAGWGGCTVSLVPEPIVSSFIQKVKNAYYFKRQPSLKDDPNQDAIVSDWIFASKPSTGAAILRL